MVCQGDASLPVPLCYAWAGLKGRMLKDKPVWKEARWRALESHGGHITLIGESRENMRGGWVFAAVTFAKVLYSKHIIINLIYTPERLSLQSIMRRDGREHRYTSIDGFGSQFMHMLPKSFHRCNNNSKTQKTPKYLWALKSHWMDWKSRCTTWLQVCCRTAVIKTAPTDLKTVRRAMEGSLEVNPHTDSQVILTGM